MDIVSRVKGILLSPKTEWPVIAGEPATVNSLYTGYAMILAAIPAVCLIIGSVLFGSPKDGLITAIVMYVLGLALLFLQAKVVEAVAPNFGGKADTVAGLKLVMYAATPVWIVGVLYLVPVPAIFGLLALVAMLYGLYLLFLGVRPITNCPEDKSLVLTLVIIGVSIIVYFALIFIVKLIVGIFVDAGGAVVG